MNYVHDTCLCENRGCIKLVGEKRVRVFMKSAVTLYKTAVSSSGNVTCAMSCQEVITDILIIGDGVLLQHDFFEIMCRVSTYS